MDAVLGQMDQLVSGNFPLGPVDDIVGNAGIAAALSVGVPRYGQVKVRIEKSLIVALHDGDMHGDDAVLDLADAAAILPLHAGRFVAFLDGTGLVDDADAAERGMSGGQPLLADSTAVGRAAIRLAPPRLR